MHEAVVGVGGDFGVGEGEEQRHGQSDGSGGRAGWSEGGLCVCVLEVWGLVFGV